MVVIAHTAGRTCPQITISCQEIVRQIQANHISLGWKDIGYNFLVGGDGQVYAGTSWNRMGRHSLDKANENSIAIAFIGNFDTARPTKEQLDAARTIMEVGHFLGKLPSKAYVVLQSQIRPFSSPGVHVANFIKQGWPWWSPLGDPDSENPMNFTEQFFNRSEWFAANPRNPFKKNNTFPLTSVKVYTTKCNGQRNSLKTVIELQKSYMKNGMDDLPSNFVIRKGAIFEGRGWSSAGAYSESLEESRSVEIELLIVNKITKKAKNSLNLLLDAGRTEGKLAADYELTYI